MQSGGKLITREAACVEVSSAAELFPRREDTKGLPPEKVALCHFYKSRQMGIGVPRPGAPAQSSVEAKIELPAWKPRYKRLLTAKFMLEIDDRAPARYFRATAELLKELRAEWRIVVRPTRKYVMSAAYMLSLPAPGRIGVINCYSLRFEQTEDDDVESVVRGMLQAELDRLGKQEVTPFAPAMLVSTPAVINFEARVGDNDEFVFKQDFKTGRAEISSVPSVADLPPAQRDVVEELHGMLGTGLGPRRGTKPAMHPTTARELYAELLPVCEKLLNSLKGKKWPPFRNPASVIIHIREFSAGSTEIQEAVVASLRRFKRRPAPKDVATKVLAKLANLTETRVRQLIRKH
jgi:hypothetical protein